MLLALLAAQLSQPLRLNFAYSADDMPGYVQVAGVSRRVGIRLTVGLDGKVEDCDVEDPSGDRKLDAFTCELAVRRSKYQPARWIDGSPVTGVDRMPVRWMIGFGKPNPDSGDVILTVNTLPDGAKSPLWVNLALAVDAAGTVVSCGEAQQGAGPWFTYRKAPAVLIPIACREAATLYKNKVAYDRSGSAVRSVQLVSVRFIKAA